MFFSEENGRCSVLTSRRTGHSEMERWRDHMVAYGAWSGSERNPHQYFYQVRNIIIIIIILYQIPSVLESKYLKLKKINKNLDVAKLMEEVLKV